MNPELQAALLRIVEATEKTGAWAWDQAPLVLHDLLVAGAINAAVTAAAGLALGLVGAALLWRGVRGVGGYSEDRVSFLFPGGGLMVGAAMALGSAASNALTIWLAPRAYLIGLVN